MRGASQLAALDVAGARLPRLVKVLDPPAQGVRPDDEHRIFGCLDAMTGEQPPSNGRLPLGRDALACFHDEELLIAEALGPFVAKPKRYFGRSHIEGRRTSWSPCSTRNGELIGCERLERTKRVEQIERAKRLGKPSVVGGTDGPLGVVKPIEQLEAVALVALSVEYEPRASIGRMGLQHLAALLDGVDPMLR